MTDDNDGDGERPQSDYEVGYCRPPKGSRFKQGVSGNPIGRKRKPKSVRAQMQAVLSKKVIVNDGGKQISVSMQEVIFRKLANMAAKGDLKAAVLALRLGTAPEYADADVIDHAGLSSDDQAMLNAMIKGITDAGEHDEPSQPDSMEIKSVAFERPAESSEGSSDRRNPEVGQDADVE